MRKRNRSNRTARTATDSNVKLGEEKAARNDYLLLALLIWLGVLNVVDRNLIVSLSTYIVPDLGLSNTQFGLLTGFVFVAFYSTAGLFMGILADRVNRTRLIAAALAVWSTLTAVSGAARGFVSLAIPRAFIGIGESALTPAAVSLLADRFPASKLGFVSSAYFIALPIGLGVSYFVAGELAPWIGWRGCFYLLGAIGLVSVPLLLLFRDPRKVTGANPESAVILNFSLRAAVRDIFSLLKSSQPMRLIIIGSMVLGLNYGVLAFDQLWLVQERGFERAYIASTTGWFAIAFGVAGTLHAAFLMDYCLAKFSMPRERFLAYTWLALLPILVLYRFADSGSLLFWAGLASVYMLGAATSGPLFAAVQSNSPSNMRATMLAFQILCGSFVGIGVGSFTIGAAIDWLISAGASQPYTLVLLAVTVLSGTGIFAFYRAGSR